MRTPFLSSLAALAHPALALLLLGGSLPSARAQTTITFNTATTPEGTTLGTQFSPAVSFLPSPLSGDDSAFYGTTGANLGTWAMNTDATVTHTDFGAESPTLAGVGQLHAYGNTYPGWLAEDGDADFLLTFAAPVSSISVTFAGDSTGSSGIANFAGGVIANVVHVPVGANTLLETATLSGLNTTSILMVPGAYGDWVSVVSITFTSAASVPEPATWAMMAGGLGTLVLLQRRRRSRQRPA